MNKKINAIIFLLVLSILSLTACGKPPAWHQKNPLGPSDGSDSGTPTPRADPGFIQQLEKRAMLANSADMAKIVSGSHLGWRSSASAVSATALMDYADTWVFINPLMLMVDGRRTTFDYLSDHRIWAGLREAKIGGIYIAPVRGSGAMWSTENEDVTGEDTVQFDFADFVSSDSSYRNLMSRVLTDEALMGSDIIPAATGIGPDFFLAIRNVREYPGIYCLVEIPKELWSELPEAKSERKGVPVPQSTIDKLSIEGLLPRGMVEDARNANCGWAATAQVSGIDANLRRWVYRYYKSPEFPVLNWEDPTRAANRIMSGSVVKQIGMQGQSLIGMKFDAFHGLEVSSASTDYSIADLGASLAAAHTMSREINRYGAWSWQRDNDLSTHNMAQILSTGVDFVSDHAFSPAAEHALLSGNASLLRYMGKKIIEDRVVSSRLVHTSPMHDGLSYSLPTVSADALSGNSEASSLLVSTQKELLASLNFALDGTTLHTTSVGLAAAALGLPPDAIPKDKEKAIRQGHLALIFFKAMQPGLVMLSGQDLVGAMPLGTGTMRSDFKTSYMSRGSYALTDVAGSMPTSGQYIARTSNLYPYLDAQVHDKGSFIQELGKLLEARKSTNISKGKIIAVPDVNKKGVVVLISEIDKGEYMLSATNFGRQSAHETIDLKKLGLKITRAKAIFGDGKYVNDSGSISISLGPWHSKAVSFSATKTN